jgi:hypothetical protein
MQRSATMMIATVVAAGVVATGACKRAKAPDDALPGRAPAQAGMGAAASTPAEPFTSPNREFSMAFPQPPMQEFTSRGVVYQVRANGFVYLVNKLDCPREFEDDPSPDRLYDALQKASVSAVNGELVSQDGVASGGQGISGRQFIVEATTPNTGEAYEMDIRLFRHKDQVWLIQAIGPRTDQARENRQGVLDSFALL